MSKLAIIAIVGVLALAATADIAALDRSIGFRKHPGSNQPCFARDITDRNCFQELCRQG
jgi:hypothetical protein